MFEIISAFSEPGGSYNEDAILYSKRFMVVVDGATGLDGTHLTNAVSDAAWLAQRLCAILKTDLEDTSISLKDILKRAAKTIKHEMDELGYVIHAGSYPSASVAIVRQRDTFLECLSLGDAPILLSISDQLKIIYDDSVALRDQTVIDRMITIHNKTGCNISEARPMVNDQLISNRKQMNKSGAYYIFDPTGEGIDNAITYTLSCTDVQYISLMSDGFSAIKSCYGLVDSDKEMMSYLIDGRAEELFSLLKKQSIEDPMFNKYPRFKLRDDASIIVAQNTV